MSPVYYLHNPGRKSMAMCYEKPGGSVMVVWTKWVKLKDSNPPGAKNRKPYICGEETMAASLNFSAEDFQAEYAKYGVSESEYGDAWALYGREM
jgi:hypothetical protein